MPNPLTAIAIIGNCAPSNSDTNGAWRVGSTWAYSRKPDSSMPKRPMTNTNRVTVKP